MAERRRPAALFAAASVAALATALAGLFVRDAAPPAGRPRLVWIFFDSAAAASDAPPALSPAALERRREQGVRLLAGDRPIPPRLLDEIERAGGRVRARSRWLRAVSAWADADAVRRIAALPDVRAVGPVATLRSTSVPGASRGAWRAPSPDGGPGSATASAGAGRGAASQAAQAGSGCAVADDPSFPSPASYGDLYPALQQMRVPGVHGLGLSGRGVRIGVLDTGFEPGHNSLSPLVVENARDFIGDDAVVSDEPGDVTSPEDPEDHGTWVWSILAGCAPGRLVGPAFGARFLLAKVEDPNHDVQANEDRWVQGLEWADSLGARVVNSSLAYRLFDDGTSYAFDQLDGDQLASTRAADAAARRGVLVVNAIGNRGPELGSLMAPADADSIIAVGAADAAGQPIPSSSRGPTADGRLKPDLMARGLNLPAADPAAPDAYKPALVGTSFATPLVSGAAALFMEAWPNLTAAAARSALLLAGSNAERANNNVGWGVPDVLSAISFPQGITPFAVLGTDANGAFTTLTPTFRWTVPLLHESARPVRYFLELASDSLFANVLARDSVGDALAVALRRPIAPSPAVWWRIVAVAANGVTRVSPRGGPLSIPAWVRLTTLNNTSGNFVGTARPTFTWHALGASPPVGPLVFTLQVLAAGSGAVVRTVGGVTDTTTTLTEPLTFNVAYRWRVIAASPLGVADTVQSVAPFVVVSESAPPSTQLYQNFPNPFPADASPDGTTHFWFDLSEHSRVELAVYDLRGRTVRRLAPLPGCGPVELDAGLYGRGESPSPNPCVSTTWDGRDDAGRLMPAGVYIARLRAAGGVHVVRVLFLRR